MQLRTLLLWAIAVRRQLERWEVLVSGYIKSILANETPSEKVIWDANIEHHLLLVASHHLLKSIDRFDVEIDVNPLVASELKEVRDLLEHWEDNMEVFNMKPRQRDPWHRSGRSFAKRNPDRSPYWWLYWDLKRNEAKVTIKVSARELYQLFDTVRDAVLARNPGHFRFLPENWLPEE